MLYRNGGQNAENALRTRCVVYAVELGDFCRSPGEHRYRVPQREHRDQPAVVPGTRAGAGLPGLLRSTVECQLFLLRWHVLGLPERLLVCEFLVQRPLGACAAGVCAAVHPAYPRSLLPAASCILSRVAVECAAPLG